MDANHFMNEYVWDNVAMEEFFDEAEELSKRARYICAEFCRLCDEDMMDEWHAAEVAVRRIYNQIKSSS